MMILVILTALAAVCGAAKLDKSYLPPVSAKTAGGSPGALLAPLDGSNQGLGGLPAGGYTNEVQGVVVDAVNPGTRTSGLEPTGLGGPRNSYGSRDSKVGEAAFTGLENSGPNTRIAPGFGSFVKSDESQADKTSGSTLKFTSDVGLENYSYGFETDNGISVGENGVASNGVQAQGGYSYTGDDGKTYSVTYTADEGGYKPQGHHLPTPPPIPEEILKALEKNAKEEAAGHVDDGSYDAQKYNDGGDYSSNGAGNNNVRPTIGGVDASSNSYVSQGGQTYRPTSGVLVGTYNPGSDASHSSKGNGVQDFGNQQSGFGLNKDQSGYQGLGVSGGSSSIGGQFGQAGSSSPQDSNILGSHGQGAQAAFSSHSTENRFGVQATQLESTHAHTHGSVDGSPVEGPSFAYNTAVTTGSDSASQIASNFGVSSQQPGFQSFNSKPSNNNLPSSGQTQFGSIQEQFSAVQPTQPTLGFGSSQGPTKVPDTELTTPFESNGSAPPASVFSYHSSNQASHSFGSSNIPVSSPTPVASISSTYTGPIDANVASNTQQPSISQQQGSDDSYYYKHPSKPFVTQSVISSSQYTNNRQPNFPVNSLSQQGSKYPNAPTTSTTGQYQGTSSSSYNGITQAAISPFTSGFPSSSNPFASQSSQFGSKPTPSSQFGQSLSSQQTSTQFGATGTQFIQKPIVQSQTQIGQSSTSETSDSSSPTQQYQGTIYQYNKPAEALPAQEHKDTSSTFGQVTFSQTNSQAKPSQIATDSRFGSQEDSSQFGSQSFTSGLSSSKPFASQSSQFGSKPTPSSQFGQSLSSQQTSTQFGATGTQFIQKPIVQSQTQISQSSASETSDSTQSPIQQYQGTIYQYNKPAETLPAQEQKETSSRFEQVTSSQTNSQAKPSQIPTDSRFESQQDSSQFGSQSFTSGFSSSSKPFAAQSSQFGSKPSPSSQFGQSLSSQQTSTQFGATGTQFSHKPIVQSQTQISQSSTSETSDSTQSPTQQYQGTIYQYNKPAETLPAQEQKDTSSRFEQVNFSQTNSQAKPSQIQTDSRFGSQQGSSQFGSQSSFQNTQTDSNAQTTNSKFGQKPQTTQGSSFTSNTYSQSQTSQFGKKPSGTSSFGQTSFGQKPSGTQTGSYHQQGQFGSTSSQFGSKPQNTQGSTFSSSTYTQSQTSQFGKKPSTTQTGSAVQPTQFGSTGFQFGQNSQSTQSSGSDSPTSKPSFGQKPFGSSFQQTQFGTTGSPFGSKPQNTQGSSFSSSTYTQSQTSQFGKKPSTTETGSVIQPTQFGSTGFQFGQNSQSTQSSGSDSPTSKPSFGQKPSGSSFQQTQFGTTGSQFGSKPQTTQGSSFSSSTYTQSQTSQFGKKPSTTQTGSAIQPTQFGSTGFQFGQNSQSTQSSGSDSPTSKPSFGQKPSGSSSQQTQFGTTGYQFGSKPQTTQGSSYSSSTYTQSQTSQFGKKPSTTQTGSAIQPTQFGSTGFQFGQNSQSTQSSGSDSPTSKPSFGQKPSGSSSQQTQFGTIGSQFGSKPQTTQGSSYSSSTYTQSQTSQFGKKPSTTETGSAIQPTQFGSTGFQFGQNSESTQSSGSDSLTSKPSFGQKPSGSSSLQTQFGTTGSQFGSKPQTTQGSSYSSSSYTQSQTSQFGKKPSTTQTGSATQPNQFGSTGFQFGQNSQSTQSSGSVVTTSKPSFGQKPSGSSSQQTQFGPTGSQFGSKPQTTQGSSFSSSTYTQSQTSQFGKKPSTTQTGSAIQPTQFGSTGFQFGQNSQSTQSSGSVPTINKPSFGQKPFGSSSQQTQFGSTGSQFGSKPQITQGGSSFSSSTHTQSQTSQFGKKPSTTQTDSTFQQTQTQFGQKPSDSESAGSFYQQAQLGSIISSQLGQKPQSTTQGSSFHTSNTESKGQSSQFGLTGSSQNTGSSFQNTQFGSQYGQKPESSQGNIGAGVAPQNQFGQTSQSGNKLSSSSSALGSNFQQSSSGSQIGQITISQAQPEQTNQYGVKPFGSSQIDSTPSRFGQTPQINVPTSTTILQTVQPTQFGQKPFQTQFGSTTGYFGQKPQAQASAFASNSDSNVAPFGSFQTDQVSKSQQTSQFGVQSQGVTSVQKPSGTNLLQPNFSQFQYTQTSDKFGSQPQFGQPSQTNVGSGHFVGQTTFDALSQKPFGSQSTQTTYQQTQFNQGQKPFGSTQGSGFQIGQSIGEQPTQNNIQTTGVTGSQNSFGSGPSAAGYNYQKPQSVFTTQYGGQSSGPQDQKKQQTQSNFNSVISTSQRPINGQPLKPFGISSAQGTFQQTQSQQPTPSTQGSSFQSQSSAVSTSQFGLQPTKPADISPFSGKPFQSTTQGSSFDSQNVVGSTGQFHVQPTQGVLISTSQPQFTVEPYKPSISSTAQASSFPNRVGSNLSSKPEGLAVSTVQTPIEKVTSSHGFAGPGEVFGGPRDPPRFDDKTGYHY